MLRHLALLTSLLFILNLSLGLLNNGSILGTIEEAAVTVTASLPYCPRIYIIPEHRIPPTNNNSLEIHVDIRRQNSSTIIYDTTVTTDNEAKATICPIDAALITDVYYDVLVKGLSHLRRIFPGQKFIGAGAGFTLDLKDPVLFAGDSHPSSDNYVNSLDVSYEILKLYTSDLRADLNRDTIVNSLEFPTLISHLYQFGDH